MSKKVPEGWQKVRLENVSEHVKDKTTSNLIPYIEIGDVVTGAWTYQIKDKSSAGIAIKAKKGDICISTVRPTRRAMITLKEDAAVSPAFTVLRNKGNSDWAFIFEAIKRQQFYDRLGILATGSTYPTCSHSDVLSYEFLLPPLYEQHKIAAILSSIDNTIEKTKAVIEQTKVVKKALMQELLTRGIPGRHKKFKKTPIGKIPEEWEVVKFEKAIEYGPQNGLYRPESVLRVRLDKKIMLPEYAILWLCTPTIKKQIENSAKKAVAQCSINQTDVKNLIMACPPIEEQRLIIDVISSNENQLKQNHTVLSCLENLKSALMQVLLTGEKRVKIEN